MSRHTPSRPVDVESLFPELLPFRRESVRLHPRPGSPTCEDSSVGGPLLWPAAEPWPVCREEHYDPDGTDQPMSSVPMVPVVQVRRADAPSVPFPEGTDLLQVLWCPYGHGEFCYPLPQVHWRDSGAVGDVLPTPAPADELPEDWYPARCVVHPEQVTEYPSWDLPDEVHGTLKGRFDELLAETGLRYSYHLAEAPGIKLGGYPGWTQEPVWPGCEGCGNRMEHLLTVSSWEFDGESWRTWLPEEDRADENASGGRRWKDDAHNPAGLCLGDAGGVYVFECRTCPDRPIGHWFDCS
ncbi:DUF1963 domain-containing protein [Streptomyces sp. NPDC101149]|uniref:DUF1963 domain-containing protein n=1 Tax=Streptomyces sp. NPDC101149 TaxID=3366113 RepID=UPI0037F5013F